MTERSDAQAESRADETAAPRPPAVVTGASSGIGYELAELCAENGHDLVIAADEPAVKNRKEVLPDE